MAGIHEQLTALFVEDLRIERSRITPQTHLVADLGFDSLAFKITLSSIEARFAVKPPEQAAMECATFDELALLVEECVRAQGVDRSVEPDAG
ncbi:phosphopantetheine-binding protein [Nocardia elegans]|uniref:Acyl carrier protein n=1 Tax=Nocardia elegans TaxID=300029 RepID=A0ABW6T7Z7_9NOCA|nr:phosphopantetheine-binding protein [Nocardia elegans]MBF6449011.1 phosphopantetheine-binding protein [Nocardia elegans]